MILMKFWQLITILCTARERERMYNYNGRVLMSVFVPSGHKLPSKSGAQMVTHQWDLSSHLQNPYDVIYEDSKCQPGTKLLSYTSVTYRWIPMSLTHVWHLYLLTLVIDIWLTGLPSKPLNIEVKSDQSGGKQYGFCKLIWCLINHKS